MQRRKKKHFCSSESSLSLLAKNACSLSPRQYCLLSPSIYVYTSLSLFHAIIVKNPKSARKKKKLLFVDSVLVWSLFGWMTRCTWRLNHTLWRELCDSLRWGPILCLLQFFFLSFFCNFSLFLSHYY